LASLLTLLLVTPATMAEKTDDKQSDQAKRTAANDNAGDKDTPDADKGAQKDAAAKDKDQKDGDRVKLNLKLPRPAFKGTPKHVPPGLKLEKPRTKPREPFLVPKGTRNLSRKKPVTSSDDFPIIGELDYVTDGDKEAKEGSYVELGPGVQWVQIDLGKPCEIFAIVTWRYHMNARVYYDVVIQVADDEDFIENVKTVFNNDVDNSAGLGVGKGLGFWETYEGHLVNAQDVTGRYVRLYSRGSTADSMNHYTEVEVYGKPLK
jgi:hypothetical protein